MPTEPGWAQPRGRVDADPAALGAAVELEQHGAQPLDHRPLGVGGDRCRAVDHHLQRRQVVAAAGLLRQAQEAHELGGHHERRGHPVLLDRPQHPLGVEPVEQHQVGAEQRRAVGVGQRARVVHRRAHQVAAVGRVAQARPQHLHPAPADVARRRALGGGRRTPLGRPVVPEV